MSKSQSVPNSKDSDLIGLDHPAASEFMKRYGEYNSLSPQLAEKRLALMEAQKENADYFKAVEGMHEAYFMGTAAIMPWAITHGKQSSDKFSITANAHLVFGDAMVLGVASQLSIWFAYMMDKTGGAFPFPDLGANMPVFDRVVTQEEYDKAVEISKQPYLPLLLIMMLRLLSFQTAKKNDLRTFVNYASGPMLLSNLRDLQAASQGVPQPREIKRMEKTIARKTDIIGTLRKSVSDLQETIVKHETLDGLTDEEWSKLKVALGRKGFTLIDNNGNQVDQIQRWAQHLANEIEWSSLDPGQHAGASLAQVDSICKDLRAASSAAETSRLEHLVALDERNLCSQCGERGRTHALKPCGCFHYCKDCIDHIFERKKTATCPMCDAHTNGALEIKF